MKDSRKAFWLYLAALILTLVLFWTYISFDLRSKWWSLLLLIPCGLSWTGLKIWERIPKEEQPRHSELLHLWKILYGLPIALTLGIILTILFD